MHLTHNSSVQLAAPAAFGHSDIFMSYILYKQSFRTNLRNTMHHIRIHTLTLTHLKYNYASFVRYIHAVLGRTSKLH